MHSCQMLRHENSQCFRIVIPLDRLISYTQIREE